MVEVNTDITVKELYRHVMYVSKQEKFALFWGHPPKLLRQYKVFWDLRPCFS